MLRLDYDLYGNYLFQYFYQLSEAERQALIELDIMLEMINEDMMALNTMILPDVLATPEAMIYWQKAMKAGWVDEHYQTKLSLTQSAILSFEMANRLNIKDRWKVFEAFWQRKNMRSSYNNALLQRQSLKFQDDVKALFSAV